MHFYCTTTNRKLYIWKKKILTIYSVSRRFLTINIFYRLKAVVSLYFLWEQSNFLVHLITKRQTEVVKKTVVQGKQHVEIVLAHCGETVADSFLSS